MGLTLSNIKKGKELKPPRVLLYGVHGIGKSTWASTAKAPIFIQTEDGLGNIACDKFPLATCAQDVYDALSLLKGDHNYKTVVIDSLDWLEKVIFNDIVTANKAKSIDDFNVRALAYAGGRKLSLVVWGNVLSLLTRLNQERGMTVILLAHSMIKRFDSPLTAPYDRYQLDLYDKSAALVNQWVDVIGFTNYKVHIKEQDVGFNNQVTRGEGSGKRVIYLEERPAFDAKNHYGLPFEVPLTNWTDLARLIAERIEDGNDTSKNKQSKRRAGGSNDNQDRRTMPRSGESGDIRQGHIGEGSRPSQAVPVDNKKSGGDAKGKSQSTKQPSKGNKPTV